MPRSLADILRNADDLAAHAEEYEPGPDADTSTPEMLVRRAAWKRDQAERELADAIALARSAEVTWSQIGSALATSPQAAQRRYAAEVQARLARMDSAGSKRSPGTKIVAPYATPKASSKKVAHKTAVSGKFTRKPARKAPAARRRAS